MNFTDWSEEITKNLKQAQEQYWKSMAEQRAKAGSGEASRTHHGTEGFEQLWSLLSSRMPKQADDVMQQVFGTGKNRDQFSDNFSAVKDVVDSLVESQLHSFGIPTKKAQEELLNQVKQLTLQNEILKERIKVLEVAAAEHEQPAEKKEFKAKANRVSKPAGVKKVAKSAGSAKPMSKVKPVKTKTPSPEKPAASKKPTAKKKAVTKSKPDDLTKIKGVGPVIKDKLVAAGIQTFQQLGALTQDQAQALDEQLGLQGRLLRDGWVVQAAKLAASN